MSDEKEQDPPQPVERQFTPPPRSYIGDSVYVEFDGFHIILTTNNGYPDDPRNRIGLEPQVWASLDNWVKQLHEAIRDYNKEDE